MVILICYNTYLSLPCLHRLFQLTSPIRHYLYRTCHKLTFSIIFKNGSGIESREKYCPKSIVSKQLSSYLMIVLLISQGKKIPVEKAQYRVPSGIPFTASRTSVLLPSGLGKNLPGTVICIPTYACGCDSEKKIQSKIVTVFCGTTFVVIQSSSDHLIFPEQLILQSQRRWLDLKHMDFRARAYRIPFTLKQLEHFNWSHRHLVQTLV